MKYLNKNRGKGDFENLITSKYYRNIFYTKNLVSKVPYYFFLFLISPLLALVSAAANFRQNGAKIIIALFLGLLGYQIIFIPGKDSYTLMETFLNHYHHLSVDEFVNEIWLMITLRSTGITVDEPYMSILSYGVAQLTENPRWLFALSSFIYGCVYVKGISLVYSEIKDRWTIPIAFLFLFFITWVSIDGINAPRHFTAVWIFFCSVYLYLKTERPVYLLLVLFSPLVHIGYSVFVLIFFAYLLIGNRKYAYLLFLLVSFFASAQMSYVEPLLNSSELSSTKMQQYSAENWEDRLKEEAQKEKSFHAEYYRSVSDVSLQFMLLASIFLSGYFNDESHDKLQYSLASVAILLLSFSNLMSDIIPVLGNRLFISFGLFALAYLIRLYSITDTEFSKKNWIVKVTLPFILLYLFTRWSIIGDYVDFKVFFSPITHPFLGSEPVSIKEFIRQILEI